MMREYKDYIDADIEKLDDVRLAAKNAEEVARDAQEAARELRAAALDAEEE